MKDDDFVVCGYIHKDNHMTSIILGQYQDGELIYKGHVTLGVGGKPFARIAEQRELSVPPFPVRPEMKTLFGYAPNWSAQSNLWNGRRAEE